MSGGFGADPVALAAVASALRDRADRLGGALTGLPAPGGPDFGRAHTGHAAAVTAALDRVQEAVLRCADRMAAFADRLDEVGCAYRQAEADSVAQVVAAGRGSSG